MFIFTRRNGLISCPFASLCTVIPNAFWAIKENNSYANYYFLLLSVPSLQQHAENSQRMCGQRKQITHQISTGDTVHVGKLCWGGGNPSQTQSLPPCLDSTRHVLTARKFSSGLAPCLALRTCCQIHNSCLIKTGDFILANRRSTKRGDLDLHVPRPLLFHVFCLCLVISQIVTE